MSIDSVAPPTSLIAGSDSLSKKPELDSLNVNSPGFHPKSHDQPDSADLGVSLSYDSPTTATPPLTADGESKSSFDPKDASTPKLLEPDKTSAVPDVGILQLNALAGFDMTKSASDGQSVASQNQGTIDIAPLTISAKPVGSQPNLSSSKDAETQPKTGPSKAVDVAALKSTPLKDADVGTDPNAEFDFLGAKSSVRRCTSLKAPTPNGAGASATAAPPKKVVRFADALGLDLTSIRHIMNADEPPIVPLSALRDLKVDDDGFNSSESMGSGTRAACVDETTLCFCFSAPGSSPDFLRRVLDRKVLLESIAANDVTRTLTGFVCVANLAFQKRVVLRWTTNGWLTYDDVAATYASGVNPTIDRFAFSLRLSEFFGPGSRMEFSVMYVAAEMDTFWDSNHGANYRVECYIKAVARDFARSLDDNPFY